MAQSSISVVIPTHNALSEKNFCIFYTIKSILWQTFEEIEVVVVDDRGSDSTTTRLTAEFPSLRIIRSDEPTNNLGRLRNFGAEKSDGDLLLFVDDDTVLSDPTVISRTVKEMQHNHFCCGAHRLWTSLYWHKHVQPIQSASSLTRTLRDISFLPRGLNRVNGFRDLNEFTFIGNFGCIRRDVFQAMGGFDENFLGWGFEDTDLMMRLCLGDFQYRILADLDLSVFHLTHPANTGADFIRNFEQFNELERQRGYLFHANHFFGVYEGDGYSVLSRV